MKNRLFRWGAYVLLMGLSVEAWASGVASGTSWSDLQDAISSAEALGTVSGNDAFGKYYRVADANAFNEALAAAKAVKSTDDEADMDDARVALETAYNNLSWNVADVLFTMATADGGYAYATDADELLWDSSTPTDLKYAWTLERTDERNKFYMKNYKTGSYVYEVNYGNHVLLDYEKAKVAVVILESGKFTFTSENGVFPGYTSLSADASGYVMAGQDSDSESQWTVSVVEAPTAVLSVTAVKYGTFVAPFDVTLPSGVTASRITGVNGENVLTEVAVASVIPAGTPVVVKSETPVSRTFSQLMPLGGASTATSGLLTGVYANTKAPAGSYVLMNHDDEAIFGHVVADAEPTVGANRCYLTVGGSPAPLFRLGGTTNIRQAADDGEATPAVIYDLLGRRVEVPARGIYIVNGKKVVFE
ncbi:MAG: hypothetical protein K6B45_07720 [Bacteroidaceae bacterium]|nr:hypothetical protein [Bacteroidaceae bacterium]